MGSIANGSGFIAQPITAATNAAMMSNASLEYARKHQQQQNQQQQQSGAAPMDLESASERDCAKEGGSMDKKDKGGHLGVAEGGGQILFNQIIPQPQGFMMMAPGMVNMMDGSSLIGMQTFPVMTAQQISTGVDLSQQALAMVGGRSGEEGGKEVIYIFSDRLQIELALLSLL